MQTIFIMGFKCELGKAYDVAYYACSVDQVSEVYSLPPASTTFS